MIKLEKHQPLRLTAAQPARGERKSPGNCLGQRIPQGVPACAASEHGFRLCDGTG